MCVTRARAKARQQFEQDCARARRRGFGNRRHLLHADVEETIEQMVHALEHFLHVRLQ